MTTAAQAINEELAAKLPRCERCGTVRVTVECLWCRAMAAEAALVREDDDLAPEWIRTTTRALKKSKAATLWPLGVGLDHPGQGPITVTVRPQMQAQPHFLTVAPECAYGTLHDIKVGNRSQLPSTGPLPLSLFNPENWANLSLMPRLLIDTVMVAQDLTMYVDLSSPAYDPVIASAIAAVTPKTLRTNDYFRAIFWCPTTTGPTTTAWTGPKRRKR